MNGSVVSYTLEHCVRCMKCIKACPTSALRMSSKNRIVVDDNRCINCGNCIRSCHNRGLLAHGSTLADIENYEYTVCMVPGALISHCSSLEEAEDLFHAIRMLGFDEVVDITEYSGVALKEAQLLAGSSDDMTYISSFCPVINRLIVSKYQGLLDSLLPINYESEIAAKQIRKRLEGKNVGIFNLCECEAKLSIAKYPYQHMEFECDHSLALADIFPLIRKNMHQGRDEVIFSKKGLQMCNPVRIVKDDDYLIADGFDKVCSVLDMAEFGLLNTFRLLILYPCFNGCIGGHMLWGNSFLVQNNIDALTGSKSKQSAKLDADDVYVDQLIKVNKDTRTFLERTKFFSNVNKQLEMLPGYDCSACGMQTCRIMAEAIVNGEKTIDDCRVLAALKEKSNENQ
ncbi:MAG: 4Fe-4S binding protein [Solobacterium sp.]|nr:4Fe-4S binding protein [Solobacterium sp.]